MESKVGERKDKYGREVRNSATWIREVQKRDTVETQTIHCRKCRKEHAQSGKRVRLFPNKRLNVDLKNIEIRVSHGLNLDLFRIKLSLMRCLAYLSKRYSNMIHNYFLVL